MASCDPSAFLLSKRAMLRQAATSLSRRFDYASILGTDDTGVAYMATKGESLSSEPFFIQRGFVVRAQRDGRIAEYSFNELGDESAAALAERLAKRLEALFASAPSARAYPPIPDEPSAMDYIGSILIDPLAARPGKALERLESCRDGLLARSGIAAARAVYNYVRVGRLFVSPRRDLMQSFGWSQTYLFGVARREESCAASFRSSAGLTGLESIDAVASKIEELGSELDELLRADRIEPGEYDVILSPDVSGTLAHESFGHGVETDMFAKGRARAAEYLGKRVASDLVAMFDGASGVGQTGSFLFDDEGNPGTKTQVIKDGIFLGGLSDCLSALRLGIPATGNGRRQAYDHKAYARMTNTYFAPGSSSLDDMIASIERGWLLDRLMSDM